MGCWRVVSLQVRSGGSSSQCAPVGPSSAGWNDRRNDRPAMAGPSTAAYPFLSDVVAVGRVAQPL
jgi:hypothetical protein